MNRTWIKPRRRRRRMPRGVFAMTGCAKTLPACVLVSTNTCLAMRTRRVTSSRSAVITCADAMSPTQQDAFDAGMGVIHAHNSLRDHHRDDLVGMAVHRSLQAMVPTGDRYLRVQDRAAARSRRGAHPAVLRPLSRRQEGAPVTGKT